MLNIYLAGFLKTYLPKFAAIRVEEPKAGFFSPSLKITPAKEKERKKIESEKAERRRREKINGGAFRFYIGYFGEKNCLTEKIYFAVTFSKSPAR